jgi:hypothetical protein
MSDATDPRRATSGAVMHDSTHTNRVGTVALWPTGLGFTAIHVAFTADTASTAMSC